MLELLRMREYSRRLNKSENLLIAVYTMFKKEVALASNNHTTDHLQATAKDAHGITNK